MPNAMSAYGMSHTRLYKIWDSMKQRCNNPKAQGYAYYGGRGIKVCSRWLEAFRNFYDDMNEGYAENLTIERKDVNGNYEPSNCKWATTKEQMKNRRTSLNYTLDGKTDTLKNLCDSRGLCYQSVWVRLEKGMPIEKAILVPDKKHLIYTIDGVTAKLYVLCEMYNKSYMTVYGRVMKGLSIEEALKRPVQPGIKLQLQTPA
jgi:hypothetical protein